MNEEYYVVAYYGITVRHRRFNTVDEALAYVNKLPKGDFISASTIREETLNLPNRGRKRSTAA